MLEIRFCLIEYGNGGIDFIVNMDLGANFQRGHKNEFLPFMGIWKQPGVSRPLCLGQINGGWVVASESCAFDLVGATYIRDIKPGEIVIIDDAGVRSLTPFPEMEHSHCIFELIYFARPDNTKYPLTSKNISPIPQPNKSNYLSKKDLHKSI